jgi:recombinational DNA repair protein RecT
MGHAYLVPYWNGKTKQLEAQFQAGWRGLVALARRSGEVSVLYPELVYEKDRFKVIKGDKPRLIHEPNYSVEDRGKMIGAYAVVIFKDSASDFEFMPTSELNKIRDSTKSKNKEGDIVGPWVTHPEEMYRKCPIRKLAKRLPMSAELQRAAIEDEFTDQGLVSGMEYIDPASEMARIATESRAAQLAEKYSKPNGSPAPEDESQEVPEENPQPAQAEHAAQSSAPIQGEIESQSRLGTTSAKSRPNQQRKGSSEQGMVFEGE